MKYIALGKSRQQGFWIMNCIAEISKQNVKIKIWNQRLYEHKQTLVYLLTSRSFSGHEPHKAIPLNNAIRWLLANVLHVSKTDWKNWLSTR